MEIKHSTVIDRPVEEVFAYVTDIEELSTWAGEIVEARKTSQGPVDEGTTWTGVIKALGRQMENTHEIGTFEPNRKFGIKITSGPVLGEVEYSFESIGDSTKVSVNVEADTGGFFRLADPLVMRMMQRQYETNFANLKDLLEAQA